MNPMIKKRLETYKDTNGMFANFSKFKLAIRRVFGISNEKQVTVRTIQHLTQKTSAAKYVARFQEFSPHTDWDDAALMTMFRRGLKDKVKDELMRDGAISSNLLSLIERAIALDDAIYEREMERKHDERSFGRVDSYEGSSSFQPRQSESNNYSSSQFTNNGNLGPAPMELDSAHKKTLNR